MSKLTYRWESPYFFYNHDIIKFLNLPYVSNFNILGPDIILILFIWQEMSNRRNYSVCNQHTPDGHCYQTISNTKYIFVPYFSFLLEAVQSIKRRNDANFIMRGCLNFDKQSIISKWLVQSYRTFIQLFYASNTSSKANIRIVQNLQ